MRKIFSPTQSREFTVTRCLSRKLALENIGTASNALTKGQQGKRKESNTQNVRPADPRESTIAGLLTEKLAIENIDNPYNVRSRGKWVECRYRGAQGNVAES